MENYQRPMGASRTRGLTAHGGNPWEGDLEYLPISLRLRTSRSFWWVQEGCHPQSRLLLRRADLTVVAPDIRLSWSASGSAGGDLAALHLQRV